WFGFIDTAYATFNSSSGGRLGLGQYLYPADITQGYVVNSGLGLTVNDFELTFEAIDFSLTHPSGTAQNNRPYVDTREHFSTNEVPTDWSEGAYAFVSTFFAEQEGAPEFDVTFVGPSLASPVPEPTSIALLVIGIAALASRRLGRRKPATA
ncbi:MAG: PEP-CTERM sorting domain-containing protein, partial [Pirellulales bacterium]